MVYRDMVTVREIFRNHDKLRPYDLFYQKQDIGFKQRNKVYKNIIRFNDAAIFSFKNPDAAWQPFQLQLEVAMQNVS